MMMDIDEEGSDFDLDPAPKKSSAAAKGKKPTAATTRKAATGRGKKQAVSSRPVLTVSMLLMQPSKG